MSQIELYQSVLLKLGRLSAKDLAALDAYLSLLTTPKAAKAKPEGIAHLAGYVRTTSVQPMKTP